MKSVYSCQYCKREQLVESEKVEERVLKKDSNNMDMLYSEKSKDIRYEGYKINEYFEEITKDIFARFNNQKINRENLDIYFRKIELGSRAIDSYLEWLRSKGGVVKEDEVILPGHPK